MSPPDGALSDAIRGAKFERLVQPNLITKSVNMISSAVVTREDHSPSMPQLSIAESGSISTESFGASRNLIGSLIAKYRDSDYPSQSAQTLSKRKLDVTMICGRPALRDADELPVAVETNINNFPSLQTVFKKQRFNVRQKENMVDHHQRVVNTKLMQYGLSNTLPSAESPLGNGSQITSNRNVNVNTDDELLYHHNIEHGAINSDEKHQSIPLNFNQQAYEIMKENELIEYEVRNHHINEYSFNFNPFEE